MDNRKEKKSFPEERIKFTRIAVSIACVILVLLTIYIVGFLIINKDKFTNRTQQNVVADTADSDAFFQDCKILEKDCRDASCSLRTWCGNGKINVCRIYDCGNEYGIFTRDANDKIKTEREGKPDMDVLDVEKNACSGSIQIMNQKCVNNKMQVTVRIITRGTCKINTFALLYKDKGAKPNTFTALKDNTYLITAYGCGEIESIVPGTKDGIALDFLKKI